MTEYLYYSINDKNTCPRWDWLVFYINRTDLSEKDSNIPLLKTLLLICSYQEFFLYINNIGNKSN